MLERLFVTFLLFCLLSFPVCAQGEKADDFQSGILYGHNYAFSLSAPPGWILDTDSGRAQGVTAVFYPSGGSWENSKVVMYATTDEKIHPKTNTLAAVIRREQNEFRQNSPKVKTTAAPTLTTKDGKKAVVTYLHSDHWDNWETVAYLDAPKVVVVLTLTARTEKEWKAALPAFEKLVRSYWFVTSDVRTQSAHKGKKKSK